MCRLTRIRSDTFEINRERAIDYLNTRDNVYVFDGYAGVRPPAARATRSLIPLCVTVGPEVPYQGPGYLRSRVPRSLHGEPSGFCFALPEPVHVNVAAKTGSSSLAPDVRRDNIADRRPSQNNMLIRPTEEELQNFGEPDFIIYNAGQFPANRFTKGMSSTTSVEINFKRMEMVILGTEYAGEMKKGVFSVMVSSPALRLRPAPDRDADRLHPALSPARQVRPALPSLVCERGRGRRCDPLLRSLRHGQDDPLR